MMHSFHPKPLVVTEHTLLSNSKPQRLLSCTPSSSRPALPSSRNLAKSLTRPPLQPSSAMQPLVGQFQNPRASPLAPHQNPRGSALALQFQTLGPSVKALAPQLQNPGASRKALLRQCRAAASSGFNGFNEGDGAGVGGEGSSILQEKARKINAKREEDMKKLEQMLLSPFDTMRRLWVLITERRLDWSTIEFPKLKDAVSIALLTFFTMLVTAAVLSVVDSSLKLVVTKVLKC